MSNRFLSIFTPLLLLLLIQSGGGVAQNLPFKHLTTVEGLPSQTVYESMQDRHGFMWFATSAGVSRFDGYKFINYTLADGLPDNEIFGFYEDFEGKVWLRSMNGKIAYIDRNKVYNSQNVPSLRALERPSQVMKITGTADSSILITYFTHGVLKYNKKHKTTILYDEEDRPAGAFAAAYENGDKTYSILRSGVVVTLTPNGVVAAKDTFPFTSFVSTMLNNKIWLAAEDRFAVQNGTSRFDAWFSTGSLVINMAKGANNSLWICTERGALHFNPAKPALQRMYFRGNLISHVLEDREGNIWFTTLNNGIMLVTNKEVKTYTTSDGLSSDKIYSIVKDGDDILVGHDNFAISRISRKGVITQVKFLECAPSYIRYSNPIVYDINVTADAIMAVTQFALFYLKDHKATIISNLHGRSISSRSADEFIVAGRYHGLSSFSKKMVDQRKVDYRNPSLIIHREAYREFNVKQLVGGAVNCVYKQNDSVFWVGLDNGLVRLSNDDITNIHKELPIFNERVVDVKGDEHGSIFVATANKGVIILTSDKTVIHITDMNGLNSNLCNKIAVDHNVLWVGTNAGINRIILADDYMPERTHIINAAMGLPSNYINAMLVDGDKVWVGTSNGLTSINRNIDGTDSYAPLVYITDVSINSESIDTLKQSEFEHQQNNLKISFVGLSYKNSDIQYRYVLAPGDEIPELFASSWQETQNTSVDFSALAPGRYVFAVMARGNRNGRWSKPVVYQLVINTPFWETTAFIVAMSALSTLLALSLWKIVQQSRKRRKAEKRTLQLAELRSLHSQMNYHFMSNAFNSLQGMFFNGNNVDQYIGKFSKLMRFTLEHSDRQLIPLSEELEYLRLYCEIEQLRVGPRFSFHIKCHEQINANKVLVPSLTLQPFIENAIWHGIFPKEEPGAIHLNVEPYDAFFKVTIEDDGIGINASLLNKRNTTRRSYGTKLIMDRIDVIRQQTKTNISIHIEDLFEHHQTKGTRVSLAFPYTY